MSIVRKQNLKSLFQSQFRIVSSMKLFSPLSCFSCQPTIMVESVIIQLLFYEEKTTTSLLFALWQVSGNSGVSVILLRAFLCPYAWTGHFHLIFNKCWTIQEKEKLQANHFSSFPQDCWTDWKSCHPFQSLINCFAV